MKVNEESEKVGLKLNIQITKIMASGPITSWQIDQETVANFIFRGSKITADLDCSHEIKRFLLLRKRVMSNLHSILKSSSISALLTVPKPLTVWITINCGKFWKRWEYQTTWPASWEIRISSNITLPTKVRLVKAMVFPVAMYGCESWTLKKSEHQRIDAFELWCWRRLLRVPWTATRSNQSTLKEISPKYPLEGLMLKQKLQYFGHLMRRADSLKKTLMLGKTEGGRRGGNRGWDGSMTSLTQWTWVWVNFGVGDGQGGLACCSLWGHKEWDTSEQWTELNLSLQILS